MRNWIVVLGFAFALAISSAQAELNVQPIRGVVGAPLMQADVDGGYVSTEIVVKFQPGMVAANGPGMTPARAALDAKWGVTNIRPFYPYEFGNKELAAKHGLDRSYILEVPAGTNTPLMADEYRKMDVEIERAEFQTWGGVAAIPNDPEFSKLYNMHNTGQSGGKVDADIDAVEAWDIHTGDFGTVTVAVIDSGVDPHPDYADRMVPGINTNNPNTPNLTTDGCPHGTHVAGTVAAEGDNGIGVAGVTWGAFIMPIRVLSGCNGTEAQCAAGIVWSADNGADVATMSLQYYNKVQAQEDAVNYAHDLGVLVIAATGNNNVVVAWPAKYANCMGVAATNDDDVKAGFSNAGPEVDLAAPGDEIYSTWVGNGYTFLSGTSMATPAVAGLAALLMSANPTLTNEQVWEILLASLDDVGPAGFDNGTGNGRINAYAAMLLAGDFVKVIESSPPSMIVDSRQPSSLDGTVQYGWQSIELTLDSEDFDVQALNFAVAQTGGGDPPVVESVTQTGPATVVVQLDRPISPKKWTTLSLPGSKVVLGYLPGDVDGNSRVMASDVLALIDSINGVSSFPMWKTDISRDNVTNAADVLRLIDVINGAGEIEAYLNAALGAAP